MLRSPLTHLQFLPVLNVNAVKPTPSAPLPSTLNAILPTSPHSLKVNHPEGDYYTPFMP